MKTYKTTFIDFDVCHRIAKFVLRDLDLLFQGKTFKILIFSETVRDGAKKMQNSTSVHFDICHRVPPQRKLYSATLTYFSSYKI